jgi:endonuclease/exonuclease/phosphatase family metal-dependent hydrolase
MVDILTDYSEIKEVTKSVPIDNINKSLKVLNYNIWFSDELRTERMISLINNISINDPDIITMQEVVPTVYNQLIVRMVNYPYHYPKNQKKNYGCIIFSKYPFVNTDEILYDNSLMNRSLIYVTVELASKKIIVATSHFESLFEKINSVKIEQFKIAKNKLDELSVTNDAVIFASDTNIVPDEEEFFFKDWIDCWRHDGSRKSEEYTYDSEHNHNLHNRKLGFYKARIDRILFKSKIIIVERFSLVKGVDFLIEPSDHFGVDVIFNMKKN